MTIKLNIKGQTIELSLDEARALFNELHPLFLNKTINNTPNQIGAPNWQPYYGPTCGIPNYYPQTTGLCGSQLAQQVNPLAQMQRPS